MPHKTALTIHRQAGKDGLKGSFGLENEHDSLQCLLSVLLKDQKAEFDWTLQHHWASFASIIPDRLDLQGSGQLSDTSLSGGARVSFSAHSAQVNMTAAWEPSASVRVTLHQTLATTGAPGELTVNLLTTPSQAKLEVERDACSMFLLAKQHKGGKDRRTSWNFLVHQRCVLLKVREETRSNRKLVSQHKESKRNIFSLEMTLVFPIQHKWH